MAHSLGCFLKSDRAEKKKYKPRIMKKLGYRPILLGQKHHRKLFEKYCTCLFAIVLKTINISKGVQMRKSILAMVMFSLALVGYARSHTPKPVFINGTTNQLEWYKVTNGKVPNDAYVAFNNQNNPVRICQANVSRGVSIGLVQDNQCAVADENSVVKVDDFQVLIASGPVKWLSQNQLYKYYSRNTMGYLIKKTLPTPIIPVEKKYMPVIGGLTLKSRHYPQTIYICRGMHEVQVVIGALIRNRCKLIYGDKLVATDTYQVLTVQSQ